MFISKKLQPPSNLTVATLNKKTNKYMMEST